MVAQQGRLLLLKIGNGGTPENFSTVGGLQLTRLVLEQQPVAADTRESGAWRKLVAAGIRGVTISGKGVFTDLAAEETVRANAFAGTIANYRLQFGNGDELTAPCLITRYEREGEMNAPEACALTLQNAGAVLFTVG